MSAARLSTWRWVVSAASGCWPYLHVRPCWSRDAARREARLLNATLTDRPWKVRKMALQLYVPSARPVALVGALRVEQVASTLRGRL